MGTGLLHSRDCVQRGVALLRKAELRKATLRVKLYVLDASHGGCTSLGCWHFCAGKGGCTACNLLLSSGCPTWTHREMGQTARLADSLCRTAIGPLGDLERVEMQASCTGVCGLTVAVAAGVQSACEARLEWYCITLHCRATTKKQQGTAVIT
jgi:hypothetical protein